MGLDGVRNQEAGFCGVGWGQESGGRGSVGLDGVRNQDTLASVGLEWTEDLSSYMRCVVILGSVGLYWRIAYFCFCRVIHRRKYNGLCDVIGGFGL